MSQGSHQEQGWDNQFRINPSRMRKSFKTKDMIKSRPTVASKPEIAFYEFYCSSCGFLVTPKGVFYYAWGQYSSLTTEIIKQMKDSDLKIKGEIIINQHYPEFVREANQNRKRSKSPELKSQAKRQKVRDETPDILPNEQNSPTKIFDQEFLRLQV